MKTHRFLFFLVLWIQSASVIYAQPAARVQKKCKSVPPPPQSVSGPTSVCFGNSILLQSISTDERYYLQWTPLDTGCTYPALAEGNSVTFSFGYKAINGIAVRQVDKVTGCRSEAYIHPVDTFQLANGDIPGMMTVREGDRIRLDLPDQSKQVVYEWITSNGGATIAGDNFAPSANVLVNYLNFGKETRYPYQTYVTLKRKFCGGGEVRHSVLFSIERVEKKDTLSVVEQNIPSDAQPAPVIDSIIAPSQVCGDRPALFEAVAKGDHLRYRWDFGDGTFNYGNPIFHTYHTILASQHPVTLTVTDTFGRTATKQTYAVVEENMLEYGRPTKLIMNSPCSGEKQILHFSPAQNVANYHWLPLDTVTINNNCAVTQTGDYIVYVSERYGSCRTGSILNVGFLNAPMAEIVGDTLCRPGGKVRLLGNTGTRNTYRWHITGPEEHTFGTPNIEFTPRKAGVYRVVLTVTGSEGCTAEAERLVVCDGK